MNLITSVVLVNKWGLIGVAIGTLVAMTYQTVWMAIYDSENIIYWPIKSFVKQIIVDILISVIGVIATKNIKITNYSYYKWFIAAVEVAIIWGIVVVVVNWIFYSENLKRLTQGLKNNR